MSKMVPALVWDESYATGVTEIDEQHMILVHTLNEAAEKLAVDGSLGTLQEVTRNLLSYALYHFETEEELMQESGYPEGEPEGVREHLAQHRAFSAKVVAIRKGLDSGAPIAPADLLAFINEWLINHILNTDRRLAAFILAQRGGGG